MEICKCVSIVQTRGQPVGQRGNRKEKKWLDGDQGQNEADKYYMWGDTDTHTFTFSSCFKGHLPKPEGSTETTESFLLKICFLEGSRN